MTINTKEMLLALTKYLSLEQISNELWYDYTNFVDRFDLDEKEVRVMQEKVLSGFEPLRIKFHPLGSSE